MDPPIACDLSALSSSERERRAGLAAKLKSRILSVRELPNGYALVLGPGAGAPVSELIGYERRCCPFLRFHLLSFEESSGGELEITGGEGVKAFLAAEFEIGGGESAKGHL